MRSLSTTVNFCTSCCDSAEREKARLFTAERLSSSSTLVMSSSSLAASSGDTTGAGSRLEFLDCDG